MLTLCSGWELDVERGPDWLLVTVRRPRDAGDISESLVESLWDLLERHLAHRLAVDLNQIRCLDDVLIDELLELRTRISQRGGVMRVCGLSPYNRRLLMDRQLEGQLVPYDDREEAVLGCHRPPQPR
jgi:anti-anti-sigma regulatory factor